MSDEIKAAAERWRAYQYFDHALHVAGRDARDLADAYIADQAQREREQAERATYITAEWLRQIGFSDNETCWEPYQWIQTKWHLVRVVFAGRIELDNPQSGRSVRLGDMPTTTRGMMLDLLSALQINTKGPDE